MRATRLDRVGETADARIVRWSFGRHWPARADMWFVLPKTVGGLAAIEKRLSADSFEAWERAVDLGPRTHVSLNVPSFDISAARMPLTGELERMGIRRAFTEGEADFSGLDASRRFFLADVRQTTRLRVERYGAVAYSVSSLGCAGGETDSPSVDIVVDRPFLFFVADRFHNILFIGRISDPREVPLVGPSLVESWDD